MRGLMATTMIAAVLATGCGWRPLGGGKATDPAVATPVPATPTGRVTKLPDFPEGAAALSPGQGVEFARTTITFDQVETVDGRAMARLTARDRDGAATFDVEVGEVVVHKDILVRTAPRSSGPTSGTAAPVVVFTLHRLSQLANAQAPRLAREWPAMRPGDVGFFSGGFVVLRSVGENDRALLDDDTAALLVGQGATVESINLRESSAIDLGGWIVEVGDAFGGEATDGPAAAVRVRPSETADAESPVDESVLTLEWGKSVPFENGELLADAIDPPPATALEGALSRTRVLLTVDDGEDAREVVLVPGQQWRWGKHAFRLDHVSGTSAGLTQRRFAADRRPAEARSLAESRLPRVRPTDPTAPVRQTITFTEGETIDFWNAQIQLVRVDDINRTDLRDDAAQFLVRDGRNVLNYRIREGNRDTVRGVNRWIVIEVRDLQPPTRTKAGEATVELSTGTFVGDTSDPRIAAQPRPLSTRP